MLIKYLWAVRTLIYSLFYKNIRFPGYIGKPILIKGLGSISIGKNVRILPGSRMETHGVGQINIGKGTSIGQNLHIISQGKLVIGRNVLISGNVLITNLDHDYSLTDVPVIEQGHIVNDTLIGENSFIGYGSVIQAGTVLGKNCIVGANSVVKGEFPDYCVIVGTPARIIKKYNHVKQKWMKYNYDA